MKLLVLQHADNEGLGLFLSHFERDGHQLVVHQPHLDMHQPTLGDFDAVWVLGGAAQVWETEQHEWLQRELELVHDAVVVRKMPFFGICLGHQILARVLGGHVGTAATSEVGIYPVQVAETESLFWGLPATFPCFHWHSAEVLEVPQGCRVTASSRGCKVQGLAWETTASSVQFHPEVNELVLKSWFSDPAVPVAFVHARGQTAQKKILPQLAALAPQFQTNATRIYRNWMTAHFPKSAFEASL